MKESLVFHGEFRTYGVSRKDRQPLLDFMLESLRGEDCRILYGSLPEIRDCARLAGDGPDLSVRLATGRELMIECKNVLRKPNRDGLVRLDFQRTRAAKSDPCSRYYSPKDFDVVAACLHSVTERWEFRFALPRRLDPHAKCAGKLSSNVHIDERWSNDPLEVLRDVQA